MAVAYLAQTTASDEEFHRISAEVVDSGGPPEGSILHLSGKAADGTRWIVDVWENAEAAQRFERERLFPVFERHGIDPGPPPTVIEIETLEGVAAG